MVKPLVSLLLANRLSNVSASLLLRSSRKNRLRKVSLMVELSGSLSLTNQLLQEFRFPSFALSVESRVCSISLNDQSFGLVVAR